MLCFGRVWMMSQEFGKIVTVHLFGQGVGLLASARTLLKHHHRNNRLASIEHPLLGTPPLVKDTRTSWMVVRIF